MRRTSILALIATLAVLIIPIARAADQHNPLLDTVATQVAGHPVSVYCENDWAEWYNAYNANQFIVGFTVFAFPVVYVSPRQCETLWALANHEDVGTYYAASALLTLVHEAVHQRGVTDEGVTDCTAIPLVPGVATQFFGIPTTVDVTSTQPQTVTHTHRVKQTTLRLLKGKFVRVTRYQTLTTSDTVQVAVTTPTPNPWLARLAVDVERWHKTSPAAYQGGC